jgi:hypothetical protein
VAGVRDCSASHFRFNHWGLVTLHRDYWDAAEELLQKAAGRRCADPLAAPPLCRRAMTTLRLILGDQLNGQQ